MITRSHQEGNCIPSIPPEYRHSLKAAALLPGDHRISYREINNFTLLVWRLKNFFNKSRRDDTFVAQETAKIPQAPSGASCLILQSISETQHWRSGREPIFSVVLCESRCHSVSQKNCFTEKQRVGSGNRGEKAQSRTYRPHF